MRYKWYLTLTILVALSTVLMVVPAATLTEAAPPAQKVKLNVWSSPDNADALAELAQLFMEEYPDIEVEVTPTSWEVLYAQILADIRVGTGAFDVTTWDLMTGGSIAEGMVDLAKFREDNPDLVDPDYDIEDFIPTAWHVYGMWGDKNIGYPFYGANMWLFYRKDYFEDPDLQAAFKEAYGWDLAPPATWEEAVDVVKFFTKAENPDSPTEYGIALMFPRTHTLFYMFINWFAPYRRSPEAIEKFGEVSLDWGDLFTADGKPAFNSPEGVKALEMMEELMKYSSDPLGSDYGETFEGFGKSLAAMCPSWTAARTGWEAFPEVSPVREKVGVAIIPGGYPVSGGWGLGINTASKHQKEAFLFIQYASSKEGDKLHWQKYGVGPTRYSTLEDPEVLEDSPWLEGVYAKALENASHRPRIPEEPKLEDIMVGTLSEILAGQKPDKAAALDELAAEWEKILGAGE